MVAKVDLERMIEQLTNDYLLANTGSAAETYLEGQLVALRWVLYPISWSRLGEKVREQKRQAIQKGSRPERNGE